MTIPDFQTVMLPLLEFFSDKKEHKVREAIDNLGNVFDLSQEERRKPLPSGNRIMFDNRVWWARLYMLKAGLLVTSRRGFIRITQRGLELLDQNPKKVDLKVLHQYPEFIQWKKAPTKIKRGKTSVITGIEGAKQTPEDSIEFGYQQIIQNLEDQILQLVKDGSSHFFENLVLDLLLKMGYGGSRKDAGELIGKSGDEGIDGIIMEDRLGLDIIYIQAKRWGNTTVGRPEVQKFVGALKGQRANKGVFITTSTFSSDAKEYISKIDSKVVLIDGERLAELMIDHNIGVSTTVTYDIKKIDTDYFSED